MEHTEKDGQETRHDEAVFIDWHEVCRALVAQDETIRLPDDNALAKQEQVSGTDVLPSDCSGCPLYDVKEHKGDTVPVSKVDRLFLLYLLWKEVYHSGYTVQIGEILARLFPNEEVVPRD